jgi:uncharacterized protein
MEIEMTPEERQLLTTLAERIRNTPPQQEDAEAAQLLRQLAVERPNAVYLLAQTVLMQDFALRNAQAQIEDLQRQLGWQQPPSDRGSGSFLGGQQYQPQSGSGSVPNVNPWARRTSAEYPPPPPEPAYPGYGQSGPGYGQGGPGYGQGGPGQSGPVMQPSQTSGFLRSAASTAAGVAGGALLYQGISSMFSGHHASAHGGDLSNLKPAESLSTATATSALGGAQTVAGSNQGGIQSDADRDQDSDMDADYGDDGDDADFGGGDYG